MDVETVRMNAQGRIVIPVAMREKLGIKAGDEITLEHSDTGVHLRAPGYYLKQVQSQLRENVPEDYSVVDELIRERRENAARE